MGYCFDSARWQTEFFRQSISHLRLPLEGASNLGSARRSVRIALKIKDF